MYKYNTTSNANNMLWTITIFNSCTLRGNCGNFGTERGVSGIK